MTAKPITCRDTTWLVSDSRERSLTAEEQASFDEHIVTCGLCKGGEKQFKVMFRQLERYLKGELWKPEPESKR
jgi:hypothetical protein